MSLLTLQMPALPDPVKVVLQPATTALLVFDMIDRICKSQPNCTGVWCRPSPRCWRGHEKPACSSCIPLKSRRAPIGCRRSLPLRATPVVKSVGQDRFYSTDLDKTLKAKGITTLVLTGWKVSGSVVYTSVGATLRGYTVVIPTDASLAATDYEVAIGQFQILNQNSANATNEPLKANASTLSRTDMIVFQ